MWQKKDLNHFDYTLFLENLILRFDPPLKCFIEFLPCDISLGKEEKR